MELIKTVTAFNGQKAELESFTGHVDEASTMAIQLLGLRIRLHSSRYSLSRFNASYSRCYTISTY